MRGHQVENILNVKKFLDLAKFTKDSNHFPNLTVGTQDTRSPYLENWWSDRAETLFLSFGPLLQEFAMFCKNLLSFARICYVLQELAM